jgi:hypothetical protein
MRRAIAGGAHGALKRSSRIRERKARRGRCRGVLVRTVQGMALRWMGAAMREAAKGFRRLKAHKQLPLLTQALAQSTRRKPSPRTSILLAPQRPHSLHASDARFAFFNISQAGGDSM